MPDYDPTALSVVNQKNEIGLTNSQHQELIEQYVELITDSMDVKTLEQFVRDTLTDDFNKLSSEDLKDEIRYSFDEETFDELFDNVKED